MSLVVTPLICSVINLVMIGQFPVSLNQEEKKKTCKNKLKPFLGGWRVMDKSFSENAVMPFLAFPVVSIFCSFSLFLLFMNDPVLSVQLSFQNTLSHGDG